MLRNKDISYKGAITLTPKTHFNHAAPSQLGYTLDCPVTRHIINHGQPAVTHGSLVIDTSTFQGKRISLYDIVIKKPGDNTYHVPKALAPLADLFQIAADHEYTHSPYAQDKLCVAAISHYPNISLHSVFYGENWHIHTYPDDLELHQKINTPPSHIEANRNVSNTMVASDIIWSSYKGTQIQTHPNDIESPLYPRRTADLMTCGHNAPNMPFNHRAAEDNEIIAGAGFYHHAQELNYKDLGKSRLFVLISHLHTPQSAEKFMRDHPETQASPWPDATY